MHFVAWIQPSLDLSTGISTLPTRMPSEKDNEGGKVRAKTEGRGGSNDEAERWQER